MRVYKERRLYFAEKCSFEGCERSFQSFKRSRIKGGLCRYHRTHKPDPNQQALFGIDLGSPEGDRTVKTTL